MSSLWDRTMALLAGAGVIAALGVVFFLTPAEATMGEVQKIFYFHLGAAAVAFLAFALVAVFSIAYLASRKGLWDAGARASAEVGLLFCTLVLLTGPIWARPVWGRWWVWEPRLTTTLILWFLYCGYLVLRWALHGHRGTMAAAVYGIVAFADVPVVWFSTRWWRGIHPVVIQGGRMEIDPGMRPALFVSLAAFLLLSAALLRERWRLELLEKRVEGLEHESWEDGR